MDPVIVEINTFRYDRYAKYVMKLRKGELSIEITRKRQAEIG